MSQDTKELNKLIDHTLLKSDANYDQVSNLLDEAVENKFNSICIRPEFIKDFAHLYRTSAVVAFPEEKLDESKARELKITSIARLKQELGNEEPYLKVEEAKRALAEGALELDPVIQVSNLDAEDIQAQDAAKEELLEYFKLLREHEQELESENKINNNTVGSLFIKPIFSCEVLDDDELEVSVSVFAEAVLEFKEENPESKIQFAYKNSTGFIDKDLIQKLIGFEQEHAKSCTDHGHKHTELKLRSHKELIEKIIEQLKLYDPAKNIKIKAAGGIRSKEDALELIEAADGRLSHIGTSAGLDLIK